MYTYKLLFKTTNVIKRFTKLQMKHLEQEG